MIISSTWYLCAKTAKGISEILHTCWYKIIQISEMPRASWCHRSGYRCRQAPAWLSTARKVGGIDFIDAFNGLQILENQVTFGNRVFKHLGNFGPEVALNWGGLSQNCCGFQCKFGYLSPLPEYWNTSMSSHISFYRMRTKTVIIPQSFTFFVTGAQHG